MLNYTIINVIIKSTERNYGTKEKRLCEQKGTTMSFVTLNDITKQYRMGDITINANDKVSFDIEKGEFAIIVGPSGSGKTTVLNIMGGMDTPTSGDFYVDGSKISAYNRKQLIDYRR